MGHVRGARNSWSLRLNRGLVATNAILDAEAFYSARTPRELAAWRRDRSAAFEYIPTDDEHWQAALDAQFDLAKWGRHRSVGVADLLISALAEAPGLTVLHYDSDFDTAATVLHFEHQLVAEPGTLSRTACYREARFADVPQGLTTRDALDLAAAEIGALIDQTPGRLIVGMVGPPGTGKSTFAHRLIEPVGAATAFMPMDGFHLSNRQLDRLGRRDRKGAPDTFDIDGYVATLHRISTGSGEVYVPDFDRTLDEPVAAGLVVPAEARVVITEGNYLALAQGAWGQVRGAIDRLYYLDCPADVRRGRLVNRHVAHGRSRADAERWVDLVDEPNALVIAGTEANCDRTLYVDDAGS